MYQSVTISKPVEVNADDVISISDAAKMTGRTINAVVSLMNRGRLPTLTRHALDQTLEGEALQRFTLRSAVMELPTKRTARKTTGKR